MKVVTISAVVIAATGLGVWLMSESAQKKRTAAETLVAAKPIVAITLPQTFSPTAVAGKALFEANCAVCHGLNAVGQDGSGPPLIHKIYEPSHHGDESFQRAVSIGAKSHHWTYGDMLPVEGLSRGDVADIVRYVRELQQANGIN